MLRLSLSILSALLLVPTLAAAQAPPAAEEHHTEAVAERGDADDDIRLTLTAGATGNYGNARNVAFNLAANFTLRLGQHAFLAEAAWIYGLAATRIDPEAGMHDFGEATENTNNVTARLRYDFFITPDDAIFAVAKIRRDPFALLEPRIGLQAGYARTFLREENHRFWGEIGYDFTYDRFGVVLDLGGGVMSDDRSLHSLRLFLGYDNRINEVLTYTTGFEALMRFDRPEHWRFEWVNQFRSKVADWLQISVDITGRFDALPPGQIEAWNEEANQPTQMFDLVATLNLVGTFDLHDTPVQEAEEEAEEAEECECPEPECPAADAVDPEADPIVAPLEPEPALEPAPAPAPEPEPAPAPALEPAADPTTDEAEPTL